MTYEQFCYWLQGKLEGRNPKDISKDEVQMIMDHLNTCFKKVTGGSGSGTFIIPNTFPGSITTTSTNGGGGC